MVTKQESLSIKHQCELLSISRSTKYYTPGTSGKDLDLMHKMDVLYTENPTRGTRRLSMALWKQFGIGVGRCKVRRLMQRMGIAAIYPKRNPNLSLPNKLHEKYPYLLRDVPITRINQVWSTDITYVRMDGGFVYLTAVIDWYSRFVLAWRLSTTLDTRFCREALEEALAQYGKPEIFNTDQGCQYTSVEFTGVLKAHEIQISMDGKGRALDNVFVERLWRTVKYEDIYLKQYANVAECKKGLTEFFERYNWRREHSSLAYSYPGEIYFGKISLSNAA
jgi:putative transposase